MSRVRTRATGSGWTPSAADCSPSAPGWSTRWARAAWLDDRGRPDLDQGIRTWITARTVHVNSLGVLLGVTGSADLAAGALAGLTGPCTTPTTAAGSPPRRRTVPPTGAAGKSAL